MRARLCAVAVLVIAAAAFVRVAAGSDVPASRRPLDQFPMTIDEWSARSLPPLDDESARVLSADEYLNRRYTHASGAPADLFIAYYGSQRQGDAIHSPRNCLPGSGWRSLATSVVTLPAPAGERLTVNRHVIEKGTDRRVVYYWYQGRGRVIASEYSNKAWLMFDSMRSGRSDGALVRVMAPATDEAEAAAAAFVSHAFTPLTQVLP